MSEETVTSEAPASAEAAPAEHTPASPATQQTETATATDPAEEQRREKDREEAKQKAAFAALRQREREARTELERERQERQALLQRVLQGNQPAAQPQGDGAPDPTKYAGGEFNPEFIREMARYEARQAFRSEQEAMTKRQQAEAAQRQREAAMQGWTKSLTEAQTKYPDYEVIVEAGAAEIPQAAKQLLVGLKDGAELLYHAAKDPEVAQRLSGNPVEIAAALGELRAEARFAAKQAAAKAAAAEAASAPINPGNAGGRSSGEPDPSNTEAWMRWRAKQK